MLVVLVLVHYWETWQDAGDEADRPAPLLVENTDGSPISVAQFLAEVHEYVLGLRDLNHKIEDREQSDKAVLFLFRISGPMRKDAADADALFAVHVTSEVVKDYALFEGIWEGNSRRFVAQQRESSRDYSSS
jgi:hypothetical protein